MKAVNVSAECVHRRMPAARTVGARIKRTIEKYIDHHPDVVQILARLGDKEFAAANTQSQMWLNEHVGNLRQQLVIELGVNLDIQGADAGMRRSWLPTCMLRVILTRIYRDG